MLASLKRLIYGLMWAIYAVKSHHTRLQHKMATKTGEAMICKQQANGK